MPVLITGFSGNKFQISYAILKDDFDKWRIYIDECHFFVEESFLKVSAFIF